MRALLSPEKLIDLLQIRAESGIYMSTQLVRQKHKAITALVRQS